jgi:hypothetical protein
MENNEYSLTAIKAEVNRKIAAFRTIKGINGELFSVKGEEMFRTLIVLQELAAIANDNAELRDSLEKVIIRARDNQKVSMHDFSLTENEISNLIDHMTLYFNHVIPDYMA